MSNADEPAYPTPDTYDPTNGQVFYGNSGLTKREYFAAMVIQGLCSDPDMRDAETEAELAVKVADALLKELEKKS